MTDELTLGEPATVTILNAKGEFQPVFLGVGPEATRIFAHGDSADFCAHFSRSGASEEPVTAIRRALTSFSGRVAVLVYEPMLARATLLTDRHGQVPVFVAQAANAGIYVASRLSPLLARQVVLGRLDMDGLAEGLAFGAPLGAKTLVEGIQVLPGAASCTIDLARSTIRIDRYWSPTQLLGGRMLPLRDTQDELLRLFLSGLDAITKNQAVALTLSGGIDSRCLLAAAVHRGIPVRAFNCSLPGSRSARYAEEMARMTGTPYFPFPVGSDFASNYGERLTRVVSMTDGLTFFSEVEAHWLRERLSGASLVLHGAFAELSKLDSMHSYWADSQTDKATAETLADVLFARFTRQTERSLACLDDRFRLELRERARSSLRRRVAQVDAGLPTASILQVLYLEEFLGKITRASSVVWNDQVPTRFPFAWPAYLDLLLQTRNEDRRTQRFQAFLLKRTLPALYRFPDANTGLRVDAPELLNKAVEIADKVRRVFSLGRTAYDHSDVRSWLVQMQPTPSELMARNSQIFDEASIRKQVELLRAPAPRKNPLALVRQKMEQYAAATSVQKALMLQLFLEQSGARVG